MSVDIFRTTLERITEWKGDHLITKLARLQLYISKQSYQANHLWFFLQNGRKVADGQVLRKLIECNEPKCISHWYEASAKRSRDVSVTDDTSTSALKKRKEIVFGDLDEPERQQILNRILLKCEPELPKCDTVPGACAIWKGCKDINGYGSVASCGFTFKTHRLAFEIYFNCCIRDGIHVRHLCGNRLCVTKGHLALGTATDNAGDKLTAGTQPIGEKHYNSTISAETAKHIFMKKYAIHADECASEFKTTPAIVRAIWRGVSWSSVTGAQKVKQIKIPKDIDALDAGKAQQYIGRQVNKVSDTDGSEHWLWKKSLSTFGYGNAHFKSKVYLAHIFSYRAYNGCEPILDDLYILHGCKFKNCVNPEHLKLGTQSENMSDRSRDRTDARGERSYNAKLKWEQVNEIRRLKGTMSSSQRARMFGVSPQVICNIDHNRNWVTY